MRRLAVQTLVAVSMLGVLGACAKPAPEPADLGAVQKALHAAADEYGVPRALMVAIGWVDSRLSMNAGAPSVDGAYGVFHLVDGEGAADPNGRSRAQSLKLAARLTGLSETALRADLTANARGAAALLRAEMDRLESQYPDLRDDSLGDWFEVTMRASGVEDAQLADGYASQVYRLLRDGLTVVDEQGGLVRLLPQTFSLSGRAIWASLEQDLSGEYCPNGACVAWVPASTSNYMAGRDGYTIDTIVIHDMEGSYSGSIAWFQDPAAQASAHYCIRSSDGEITQQVHHADTAWHSGNGTVNRKSIGIEHEGFAAQGQTWYTEAMYKSSAALVRWLADTFNVTRDRAHIIGHYEVPDASHAGWYGGANHHHDPCDVWLGDPTWHNNKACYWNWDHYMALVNGTGPTGVLTGFVGDACCGIAAATRKPLVGATVTLVGTSSTAVTDSTGFYTFTLPAGTYTPRASMTNYTTADHTSLGSGYSAQIAVSASTTAYGSIVLAASAPSVTKPVVKIVKPVDGSSSATAQVTVTGTVDDKAVTSVVIGTKSYAASAGAFTGSFDLVAGLNTITVSATNAAGTGSASARVSYAPPSTGIQGTVMSTSSTPIAGVKLVFTPGSAQVITDADGKYTLGLAAGTYTLAATAPGYLDKTQSVTVPADRILTQDLVLTVDPSAVPRVRIDSPANGQVFTDPVVDVSGFAFVQNLAALTVNGETVAFAGDHSFDVAVTLAEGPNTILIEATDAGGQAVHAQVTVEYAPAALSAGGCGSTGVNPGVWMLVVAGVVMARRRTATVHGLTAR